MDPMGLKSWIFCGFPDSLAFVSSPSNLRRAIPRIFRFSCQIYHQQAKCGFTMQKWEELQKHLESRTRDLLQCFISLFPLFPAEAGIRRSTSTTWSQGFQLMKNLAWSEKELLNLGRFLVGWLVDLVGKKPQKTTVLQWHHPSSRAQGLVLLQSIVFSLAKESTYVAFNQLLVA